MKLLILTQKIDKNDGVLGFFHGWVKEISSRFDLVTVICLGKGEYSLPENVKIFSLGKETGRASKLSYILNFYKLIWRERRKYDAVFVHMNQEYILLGSLLWKAWGKKVFLWRNHPKGDFLTNIAAAFSDKIFYTSPFSYTARFKKGLQMPVGIDTELFKPQENPEKTRKNEVLFFGRIAPVKKPEVLIDALALGNKISADIVGDALPKDQTYLESLKNKVKISGLQGRIHFLPGISHEKAAELLASYKIYVNTTPTGSMDKTIFEAMACETLIVSSNKALTGEIPDAFIFKENDVEDLAKKLAQLMALPEDEAHMLGKNLREYVVNKHSIKTLGSTLAIQIMKL